MATQSPLAQATTLAGSKKELVEKVKALATENLWINRLKSEKSWNNLSNTKLLRLHKILTEAGKRFGSRAEIIDAIAALKGHGKDADYKKALEKWPLPRLMDTLSASEKAARAASRAEARKNARKTAA